MRNIVLAAVVTTAFVIKGPLPTEAVEPVAEFNPPPVGTVWVYDEAGAERQYQRLPDGTFKGLPVARLSTGEGIEALDAGSWSLVAKFDDKGELVTSAEPNNGDLNWPLEVGKKWQAVRTYSFHPRNKSWSGATTQWVVEAYEEVDTPAGAFMAFRLQSTGVKHDTTERTVWYAPDPGVVVKEIYKRSNGSGFTRSLKSIHLP
jgi:hypothetical protein